MHNLVNYLRLGERSRISRVHMYISEALNSLSNVAQELYTALNDRLK